MSGSKRDGSKRGKRAAKAAALEALVGVLEKHFKNVFDLFDDYETPLVDFRFKEARGGDFMLIVKRETGLKDEVLFSGAEDMVDAFWNLEMALRKNVWREDKPWTPNKGAAKKK